MKIIIEAESKEIAALVLELQERHLGDIKPLDEALNELSPGESIEFINCSKNVLKSE